jgi:hypothetical protein
MIMMVGYTMRVIRNDLPSCIYAFTEVRDGIEGFMSELGTDVESDLLEECIDRCPAIDSDYYPALPSSTGNLKASHDSTSSSSETGFVITVHNDADYASFVHDGHDTVEARPWMQEAALTLMNRSDEYVNRFIDWVASVFEGGL